jgi:two-component system response regulator VicR
MEAIRMGKTVLIVEDEQAIVEILKFNLRKEGYDTLEAFDGKRGLELAQTADPDLVLLDVMLPEMNGFDVCDALRTAGSAVPIIMLTAREGEEDKVFGLESGADDYITKPFSMRELMARVKANIRRRSIDMGAQQSVVTYGDLAVNVESYGVTKGGVAVELTQKEYDLLRFLILSPGKVFSREALMEHVWNYDYFGDMRTVDVTVRRLREKIEDDPGTPVYILTRRGVGYQFAAF